MTQDQWLEKAEDLAFQWAHAAYLKGSGKPYSDIEYIRAKLRAHLQQRPLPEDEASIPIQCKKCLAITNEGNGCELDGCPVAGRPLPVREGADNSHALVQAIAGHIDGWRSATFGWQDDPDPATAERNKQRAIHGHAAECLRRISAEFSPSLPVREEPTPTPLLDAMERAKAAMSEFRQQDDYLLAHGASLMSDDSHEIIHIDTLTKIVLAVLASSPSVQNSTAGVGAVDGGKAGC